VPQQPTNGVDPEVAEALKNPKVRAALQEEATAHATARAQYLQSVQQLGNLQTAAMLAEFPELAASGNPRGTLELMRVSNPERFAAISGRLSQIQQTVNHWNGLQQQQHQQQAQQFEGYSKAQDNEYDAFLKTRPAHEAKVVQQNLQGMFDTYGIDVRALEQLYRSSPVVRSAQFQKMAHDLALFHAARQASSQRGADPNIPRVFTPGDVSDRPSGESVVVAEKMREFAQDPNPRKAAAVIAARRRAAALR
jgi:hypothetical protein